jgi:hypothetical protein
MSSTGICSSDTLEALYHYIYHIRNSLSVYNQRPRKEIPCRYRVSVAHIRYSKPASGTYEALADRNPRHTLP